MLLKYCILLSNAIYMMNMMNNSVLSLEDASEAIPGVHVSVSELPVLAVTERVDVSVLHQHHCEATQSRWFVHLFLYK